MQSKMRIAFKSYDKLLALSKLKPNKFQRNKHPKDQVERLAKIMREHGVRHPIHISKRSGQVCFGHGRWEAAKLNGWKEYPVVYQDFKSDKEEYTCVQSDNAIAAWSDLDVESIKMDVDEFGEDFDTDLLGIEDFIISDAADDSLGDSPEMEEEWILSVYCNNETDLQALYEEMQGRGLKCKLIM